MNNNNSVQTSVNNKIYCAFCPSYCCYKLVGSTLYLTAEDINRIARHFQIKDGEVRMRYMEGKNTFKTRTDGSCIFLINGVLNKRCSIHTARPRQCQNFPYKESCPYLIREDLLQEIHPKIEKSLSK
jgi:Fe-S-cluster containining protein